MHKLLVVLSLLLLSAGIADAQGPPHLADWESAMVSVGTTRCAELTACSPNCANVDIVYYDGPRVYEQIHDYTGTASWQTCAQKARDQLYGYYDDPNSAVAGFRNYSNGALIDYQKNGHQIGRDVIADLYSDWGAGGSGGANGCMANQWIYSQTNYMGRDSALCLIAQINAEKVGLPALGVSYGAPYSSKRAGLVEIVKGYIDQRFISKTLSTPNNSETVEFIPYAIGYGWYQPFLVASFQLRALIEEYEASGDATIPPYVKVALDSMWADAWIPADQSMWYDNYTTGVDLNSPWQTANPDHGHAGAPDTNQLIAPAYYWYWKFSGDSAYRDKGDALFQGGITYSGHTGSYMGDGKHFDQNYMWSFEGLVWRANAPAAPTITTTSLPNGKVGVAYSQQITVSGGLMPFAACDETVGALPAGAPAFTSTANGTGCLIAGTPNTAATYNFTERVTDTTPQTASHAFTIVVDPPDVLITTPDLSNSTEGASYSDAVACTGGTAPYTFSVQSGALCTGLSLTAGTGAIDGTTTVAQTCSFTIRCTDNVAAFDDQAYSITVAPVFAFTSQANPGSTTAVFQTGYNNLDRDADCQVAVFRAADPITSAISTFGLAVRWFALVGLTPSTTYSVGILCNNPDLNGASSFRTTGASTGSQTVSFDFGPPPANLVGAARMNVVCDVNSSLSTPVSVQNTSCASGCRVNHSLTSGVYYCYHQWKDSSDVVLAQGRLLALPVP